MKKIKFVILSMLVFSACDNSGDQKDQNLIGKDITAKSLSLVKEMNSGSDDIEDDYDNVLYCHFDESVGFGEVVVRNEEEFGELVDAILENGVCHSDQLPEIDFSKHILIGKYISGGGCSLSLDNEVYEDTGNKTITYYIRPEFTGLCDMFIYSWNWMLIPQVDGDYTITFEVETNG